MARQGRLHVPHATYFVVNRFSTGLEVLVANPHRSHDREQLDRIAANRERFASLLRYLCKRWCARVHAYCWLPDSALLLVRIGDAPLECIMHTLRGLSSQFLRDESYRAGQIHVGRYAALLIDPDDYLLDFARHIFWSPVREGLCKNPLGHEHSSARACIPGLGSVSLCDSTVPDALRLRGQLSRLGFARFLAQAPAPGFLRLLAHGSRLDRRIAGSTTFVREAQHRAARQPSVGSPESAISWVAVHLSIDAADIVGRSRRAAAVEGRALVAWLVTCSGAATLTRVARWFSCDPSTLHRALDHYSAVHPHLFNEQALVEFTAAMASAEGAGTVVGRDAAALLPDDD